MLMQKKVVRLNREYSTKKSISLFKLATLSKYKKEPKEE